MRRRETSFVCIIVIVRPYQCGRVLVICHVGNPASRAVILANGGVLEDVRKGIERYWIALESKDGNRAKHAQAMPKK